MADGPRNEHTPNNLNFMRLLLATLVVLGHSTVISGAPFQQEYLMRLTRQQLDFGTVAVDGFFVLSGYLIIQSWMRSVGVLNYMQKRLLRIWPGFFVAYIISVFVVGALGASDVHNYYAHIDWHHLLTRLIALNQPGAENCFVSLPQHVVNGSMWTIVYEFGCYLFVIVLGLLGAVRQRTYCLITLVACWLLYIYVSVSHFSMDIGHFTLLGTPENWPRFLTFFLAGCCFYLYRDAIVYSSRWMWAALLGLLLTLIAGHQAVQYALPLFGTYVLLYCGFLPSKWLSKVGAKNDLSYGLYLYAWPIQMLLMWYFRPLHPLALFVFATCLAAGAAWLSWHCVEKPALSFKRFPLGDAAARRRAGTA